MWGKKGDREKGMDLYFYPPFSCWRSTAELMMNSEISVYSLQLKVCPVTWTLSYSLVVLTLYSVQFIGYDMRQ